MLETKEEHAFSLAAWRQLEYARNLTGTTL